MTAKINYTIKILPIGDSRTEINIDNTELDITTDNYGIIKIEINYDILHISKNVAVIQLLDVYACKNKNGYSNISNDIRKGDIVQIYENNSNTQLLIFIGFIDNLKSINSMNNDFIILTCFNLLQQLSTQNAIKSINTLAELQTDKNNQYTQYLIPNSSTLENTLNILFDGTLIQYAYEKQYIESVNGIANVNNPYAFIAASGTLTGALALNNYVIVALSPTMKKTEALMNILQIYQYIFYQDQFGIVRIQPLSTNNLADEIYNFSLERFANDYTPYETIEFNDNIVINEVIVTAINAGAIDLELSSMAQVVSGLFQREYDLLQTDYFTNLIIDQQNLPTSITQNQTALNIWYNSKGKGNPYINVGNSIVNATQLVNGNKAVNQVLQLISTRDLCQELINDSIINVNFKRDFSIGIELPFGKMINFNSAGRTLPEYTNGLCISCKLTFDNDRSDLSLQIVKPFTITSIWDETTS